MIRKGRKSFRDSQDKCSNLDIKYMYNSTQLKMNLMSIYILILFHAICTYDIHTKPFVYIITFASCTSFLASHSFPLLILQNWWGKISQIISNNLTSKILIMSSMTAKLMTTFPLKNVQVFGRDHKIHQNILIIIKSHSLIQLYLLTWIKNIKIQVNIQIHHCQVKDHPTTCNYSIHYWSTTGFTFH